jgi:hypothetical protein
MTLGNGQGGDPPPPPIFFPNACAGSWGSSETTHALAYEGYTSGQPGAEHELFIEACDQSGTQHVELEVPLFGLGSSATDSGDFLRQDGATFTTTNGITVTITSYGPVPGLIEGTYTGTMDNTNGTGSTTTVGAFSLCHVSSFLPP